MPDPTPRDLLARADRELATVSAAEWAQSKIRLGERPVQRGEQVSEIDYTQRERAALGGAPGICRELDLGRTFMCDLDAGHAGPHAGFELPTVVLDESATTPTPNGDPA